MSSWKEKLAKKATTAVAPAATAQASSVSVTGGSGWKQRINDRHANPDRPVLPKISIDDLNDFPTLGRVTPATQEKKQPALTGFATLAREWSEHAKEEKEREDKENMYREQQAYAYNYNISKLNAINNRLMAFNSHSQVAYNDEYNADYEKDLSYHNDDM